MEDKFKKLDELVELARELIDEQKIMVEQNRDILSEIDHLYKRINEDERCCVCQCEEY